MRDRSELKKGIFWGVITLINAVVAYIAGGYFGGKCGEHIGNYLVSEEETE